MIPDNLPPPIRTDVSNAFAHDTMRRRVPAILREIQQLNPDYPASIQRALEQLLYELENDAPIKMFAAPAPDYVWWEGAAAERAGHSWQSTDWFFAETYFYRLVIEAVRWWEMGRDPFAPKKAEEYASPALWELLEKSLDLAGSIEERLAALLGGALWGNRIDLSFAASLSRGVLAGADDLLVDDGAVVVEHLLRVCDARGEVHFICDNAGTELAMDLALVDALLAQVVDCVVLHVKMHPMFVSDTIAPDVLQFLTLAEAHQPAFSARLREALEDGRLRIAPDFFWNSAQFMWKMPDYLRRRIAQAGLVIVKGDANYRRCIGDAFWDAATPFADVMRYFPAPVLALRTLKSDALVGLPAGVAERLDAVDPMWRSNGQRGVMQFAAK